MSNPRKRSTAKGGSKKAATKKKAPAKKKAVAKKAKKKPVAKKAVAKKAVAKKAVAKKAVAKPTVAKKTASVSQGLPGELGDKVRVVRELAAIVQRRGLSELIFDLEDVTITLRRGDSAPQLVQHVQPALQMMPQMAAAEAAPAADAAVAPGADAKEAVVDGHLVTSPFVGTFYRRPNPDAPPYVEVGARVQKGDMLCIVEAMKLMNEIEADASGVIAEILVEDSQPVEYGQALFRITP